MARPTSYYVSVPGTAICNNHYTLLVASQEDLGQLLQLQLTSPQCTLLYEQLDVVEVVAMDDNKQFVFVCDSMQVRVTAC